MEKDSIMAATDLESGVALLITDVNIIDDVINEDATKEVVTPSGNIPSLRKALADNAYFQDPVPWSNGNNETNFNQLRTFTDGTVWWSPSATNINPVPMGVTPVGDSNWYPWQDRNLKNNILEEVTRFKIKGTFAAGFTYETVDDVGLDNSGNPWSYTGNLPFTVPAGTTPTDPTYQQVLFSDLQAMTGLSEVSQLNSTLPREVSLSTAIADNAETGTLYSISDLGDAPYIVVASTDTGGFYIATLANGNKLRLNSSDYVRLVWCGADATGANYSNDALRGCIKALGSNGGEIDGHVGQFKFQRELDPNQPPDTAAAPVKVGFALPDNIKLSGAGRDLCIFDVEFPNQTTTPNPALDWVFIAHSDNFECEGIWFRGDLPDRLFEFSPVGNRQGFLVFKDAAGSITGSRSSVQWCRFTNCMGLNYYTSIIQDHTFQNNHVVRCNGHNVSGRFIDTSHNLWESAELSESAGFGFFEGIVQNAAMIAFDNNQCYECNGGAIGGNASSAAIDQTVGYSFSNNILVNRSHIADSGFSIANNAIDCSIDANTIIGAFRRCLTITEGGIGDSSPFDIAINGGVYHSSVNEVSTTAIQVEIAKGNVWITGATLIKDSVGFTGNSPLLVNGSGGVVHLCGGTNLLGYFGVSFSSGNATQVQKSPSVNWEPRLPSTNTKNFYANVANTSGDVLRYATQINETNGLFENPMFINRKFGGNQTDERFSYFLMYLNGKMGWGDPTVNNQFLDVYLERLTDGKLGITGTLNISDLPTSSAGLVSGDLWNDSGTVKVV
ncbi:MAG: hypothetical protein EX285_03500 [Thaumarchaeota archaeon]|nr:hypothetical protein [Nitrososphaerota archaeon]